MDGIGLSLANSSNAVDPCVTAVMLQEVTNCTWSCCGSFMVGRWHAPLLLLLLIGLLRQFVPTAICRRVITDNARFRRLLGLVCCYSQLV